MKIVAMPLISLIVFLLLLIVSQPDSSAVTKLIPLLIKDLGVNES